MIKLRYGLLIISLFLSNSIGFAQTKDSTALPKVVVDSVKKQLSAPIKKTPINLRDAIVPTIFIAYGVIALFHGPINQFNYAVQDEIYLDGNHKKVNIDNFTAAAPAVTV